MYRHLSVFAASAMVMLFSTPLSTRSAAAAEPERTIVASYYLNEVPYTDGLGNERVHFDAVVQVPDVEGATYYLMEARGGYDPYFYFDAIDASGPPFDGDEIAEKPGQVHWWFLSGGDGPASSAAERRASFDSRFGSGWEWKVRVGFANLAARLEVEPHGIERNETFDVRVRVYNAGHQTVFSVAPNLQVVSDGDGQAEVVSGPDPQEFSSLFPGNAATFEYTYKGTESGLLTLSAEVTSSEDPAQASVDCSADDPRCTSTSIDVEVTDGDLELSLEQSQYTFAAGAEPDLTGRLGSRIDESSYTDVEISFAAFAVDPAGNATGSLVSSVPDPLFVAKVDAPTTASANAIDLVFKTALGLVDSQLPEGGLLAIDVTAVGKDKNGKTARATRDCGTPSAQAARPGQPGCDPKTGRFVLRVTPGCAVEIFDETPSVSVMRSNLHLEQNPNGQVIACGGGGSLCKILNDPGDYADSLEVVEKPSIGTTKNVGQEVILRADVALPAGKTVDDIVKVEWTIGGTSIESYSDFSAFQRGRSTTVLFAARGEASDRVVSKPRRLAGGETAEDWDRVWFLWKTQGAHAVTAEVTIDDGAGDDIVCRKELWFQAEQSFTDPARQPEKFYTSCCTKALDPDLEGLSGSQGPLDGTNRVSNMHVTLHQEDDEQPIFPGESWINFHRVIVQSFDAWRSYFGYPNVGMWNGAIPIPETEYGYDTTEPSRFTSAPKCGQFFASADALCPLPPWFTREGALDDDDQPIVRPEEPLADGIVCKNNAGVVVPPGQAVIDDFITNRILGCVLAKTWHANLHFLINGAMVGTSTSPQDPVFWRVHNFLSGAEIGGTPGFVTHGDPHLGAREAVTDIVPAYLAWELGKAQGPPGVSVGLPQAGRHLSGLPAVTVQFWEHVAGVDAGDLSVAGSLATDLDVVHVNSSGQGDGRDYYVFSGFAPPALGETTIAVLPGGIVDDDSEPFAGASWSVTVAEDSDGDGVPDSVDNCPEEPNPTQSNTDHNGRFNPPYGTPHHHGGDALGDACDDDDDDDGISDDNEIARGTNPIDANDPDGCPDDPLKREPGLCGCGIADVDSDGDRIVDCSDACPNDEEASEPPCAEGCGVDECMDVDDVCKRCGQPVSNGVAPTATDALAVLRVGVGLSQCATCVCDVDGSGGVVATDALVTLKRAVGQPVELACHGHQR